MVREKTHPFIRYSLVDRTQHADGSWLAESHVKSKAQPYFENGDPHGEHPFPSTAATAWVTAALAPTPTKPEQTPGYRDRLRMSVSTHVPSTAP
jgi:hypothetical protein